jgi:hypothetical protein
MAQSSTNQSEILLAVGGSPLNRSGNCVYHTQKKTVTAFWPQTAFIRIFLFLRIKTYLALRQKCINQVTLMMKTGWFSLREEFHFLNYSELGALKVNTHELSRPKDRMER